VISSKNIERLEHSKARLSLTVPRDEVKKEYDALLREYSKSVRIDGFRPGHVPASVLERKFGEGLKLDAMGRIMDKAVQEALKDADRMEQPIVYSSPSLDGQPDFSLEADFSFAVTYDVFPAVEVGDWKGIEVELPQVEISDEDEARELEDIRERNAIVVEREAGVPAARGDVVTLSFHEIGEDGQILAGTERQDFTFEIGTGYNIYKFDDDIVGMKRDEEKILEKSYPADFEFKELAGKTVKLSVKVTKIKEKKLPALDDELAQDVSEKYQTLADLRADIRSHLEKRLAEKTRQLQEQAVVETLLSRSKADIPESMIDAEIAMRMKSFMRQLGISEDEKFDRFLSYSGKTRADLAAEWRDSALKSIMTRLILEKLVEEGGYDCSDADLEAEFSRQASETSLSAAEIKAEYEKRGTMEYLRERIKEDKLMAAILAEAKIKKGKKISFMDMLKESE
jgi:trigger factor